MNKLSNKALLFVELPFYPFLYWYLTKSLKTKQGRKNIYLKTRLFVPFRRLHVYILDKMFVKAVGNYSLPSYEQDEVGFILDLKHLVANRQYIKDAFDSNYRFTLSSIAEILKDPNHQVKHIIEIGAGSGILTRAIKDSVSSDIEVSGIEIRKETIEYNKLLYPDIGWEMLQELEKITAKFGREHTMFVSSGVLNFMSVSEIRKLLDLKARYIVWFYHTTVEDRLEFDQSDKYVIGKDHKGYVHYNLGLFLKEYGYRFDYTLHVFPGKGAFVSGISTH